MHGIPNEVTCSLREGRTVRRPRPAGLPASVADRGPSGVEGAAKQMRRQLNRGPPYGPTLIEEGASLYHRFEQITFEI